MPISSHKLLVLVNYCSILISGDPQEIMNREVLSHLYGNLCGIGACEDTTAIVPRDNLEFSSPDYQQDQG